MISDWWFQLEGVLLLDPRVSPRRRRALASMMEPFSIPLLFDILASLFIPGYSLSILLPKILEIILDKVVVLGKETATFNAFLVPRDITVSYPLSAIHTQP